MAAEEAFVAIGAFDKGIGHVSPLSHSWSVPIIQMRRTAFQTDRCHRLHVVFAISVSAFCTNRGCRPRASPTRTAGMLAEAPLASIAGAPLRDCVFLERALSPSPLTLLLFASRRGRPAHSRVLTRVPPISETWAGTLITDSSSTVLTVLQSETSAPPASFPL